MGRRREILEIDEATGYSQSQGAQLLRLATPFRKFQRGSRASQHEKGSKFESLSDGEDPFDLNDEENGSQNAVAETPEDQGAPDEQLLSDLLRAADNSEDSDGDQSQRDDDHLMRNSGQVRRQSQPEPSGEYSQKDSLRGREIHGNPGLHQNGNEKSRASQLTKKRTLPSSFTEPPKRTPSTSSFSVTARELFKRPALAPRETVRTVSFTPVATTVTPSSSSKSPRPLPVSLTSNAGAWTASHPARPKHPLRCRWAQVCPRSSPLLQYSSEQDLLLHIMADHATEDGEKDQRDMQRYRCSWGVCMGSGFLQKDFVLHLASHFREGK